MMSADCDLSSVGLDVSRETISKLIAYCDLVKKWNPAINLVSKSSVAMLWQRHIQDSAQIYPLIPVDSSQCLDVGSGGGLPAIVLAILSQELDPKRSFTLIESDQRKAAFLRESARNLDIQLQIMPERAEMIDSISAEVLTARALAPLSLLLDIAARHLKPDGVCLFPKGGTYLAEIELAKKEWAFNCVAMPSKTDNYGVILMIQDIRNV